MSSARKRVVLVCDWFLPGENAGGPLTSIRNLLELLGEQVEIVVVTRDHDAGSTNRYASIRPNCLVDRQHFKVIYVSSLPGAVRAIAAIDFSTLYVNSLFSPLCNLCVLWCLATRPKTRVVTAVRGELGNGALSFSPRRKRLFLGIVRATGIFRRTVFHAASSPERADIARELGRDAVVVPNVPTSVRVLKNGRTKQPGSVRLVYLSRIVPKKNLLGALSYLSAVDDGHVTLDIFGQLEDEAYVHSCEQAALRLPGTIRANFHGPVPHAAVEEVLSGYHVLLLPTLNENFGHVILEALQAGVLPMISDQTPWGALATGGIGWCNDVGDTRAWTRALAEAVAMDEREFSERSDRAKSFARSLHDREALKRAYLDLLVPCNP